MHASVKKMFSMMAVFAIIFMGACTPNHAPEYNVHDDAELPDCLYAAVLHAETPVLPGLMPSIFISTDARHIERHDWRGTAVTVRNAGDDSLGPVIGQIRGRGSSTWRYMGEKRSFRIRLNEPHTMPGSDVTATDWSFIANASEPSLMRSYAAYHLAGLLRGGNFAVPTRTFMHVYLNGDYRGVYMLTDQVHVHEGRIQLSFHQDPMRSEYFVQWCRHARMPDDVYVRIGANQQAFEVRFPSGRRLTDAHTDFVRAFLTEVDAAMDQLDFERIAALIDLESFVDFYIINEFFKNVDVGFSSVFFQIRQTETGPRLYAGPIWDFDQSAGSSVVRGWFVDYGPERLWAVHANAWMRPFVIVPELRQAVADRWHEIRHHEIEAMMMHIERVSVRYRDCFERNFVRWPNHIGQYVWRTPLSISQIATHEGQVNHLLQWLNQRMDWLDTFFY